MLIKKTKGFISPDFLIRKATKPWEFLGSDELRYRTFVMEQGIFEYHDRDEIDKDMMPIVAISTLASEAYEVVGTVRIHEPEKGVWWGSRLSVAGAIVVLVSWVPNSFGLLSVLPATTDVIFFLLTYNSETFHCSND